MWTKPYGTTGKDVTAVSFGGMRFADPNDIDGSAETVLHAYNKGINYFDTAPGYCGDKSEDIMGAAFAHMDRSKFYVSTKCNRADGGELRESIERSLKRMGVETLDFFHIWCVLSKDAWQQRKAGGAVDAAVRAKEEGLVNHVVVSSHLPGDELSEMLADGPFEGVTLGYCAINFPYREQAVRDAASRGLGVVTMNPLGGGLIPQHADRFDFLKGPEDRSVVEAAIRFNVSHDEITTALVGFSNKDHVDQAVAAVEDFTPWPADRIDAVRKNVIETFDGLCTGCGYCLPCPQGLPVPKLMDAYNQRILQGPEAKNIGNRLKWHWGMKPSEADACSLCGACEDRCTQHLPIRERIQEIQQVSKELEE